MRILVTAGPTYEFIDAVRFIGNPSSGKMGFEVARVCANRGHKVILISGPTYLKPPQDVKFIPVTSANEMYREVLKVYKNVDAVIMTAAVSDYRPKKKFKSKIKKVRDILNIRLVKNPDILSTLGRKKGKRILIGFAIEASQTTGDNAERNALQKLRSKNLDYIVLNSPSSFGGDKITCAIFSRDGKSTKLKLITKKALAGRLIKIAQDAVSKIKN